MSTFALKKRNQNFIVWEPVPASQNPFTAISFSSTIRHVYTPSEQPRTQVAQISLQKMPTNIAAESTSGQYAALTKLARRLVPDVSWFEEDFTKLRHPGR